MRNGLYPVARSHLDMFNFSDGSEAENRLLIQSGHFPWWTHPRVHLSMWRPLSSALMSFDFAVFGDKARLFHAHSVLWWALLVAAAGAVLWRLLPKPAAAAAILLFAIEEGHGLPVAWPANRSTLVAGTFGFCALALHMSWRTQPTRWRRALGLLCCVLALAAGEYAFTAFAYLFAFEVLRRGATRASVWRGLWPVAAAGGIYLVIRQVLGYGIEGSGYYISPSGTPWVFLGALAWRLPVLVGDLTFGVAADWYVLGTPWRDQVLAWNFFPPDVWYALPSWHAWQITIGCAGLALVGGLLWTAPRWASREPPRSAGDRWSAEGSRPSGASLPDRAATLRWLVLGALLSLVPVAGTMVSSRLTVAASLGFDALLAELLVASTLAVWRPSEWRMRALAAVSCGLILWVHGYRCSERSYDEANWYAVHTDLERDWIMGADIDDRTIADQQLIVFAAQDVMTCYYFPYVRAFYGRPRPRSVRLLSGSLQAHDLTRVSAQAFDLNVLTSDVERMAAGSNYRPEDAPFAVGDEVHLDGLHVKVLAVYGGQPVRTRFTFDAPLEDPRYVFLHPTERGLRRVLLPGVGERIRLKRPTYPSRQVLDTLRDEREGSRRAGFGGALAPIEFQLFKP
ncbi:MAG TPA: hypothetical protein VJV78_48340 [Polyangiales bacterium]|nr:hypothetical protein [Polyangiales bacterium]